MTGLKIRRATEADAVPWTLLFDADGPRAEVEKYLARGEQWLAEQAGELVGQMVLMETRADTWEIMNIAVADARKGQGIGTAMLKKAKLLATQRGAHRLEVGTGNSSLRELGFYQRFGFRIVGVDFDFFVRRWGKATKQGGIPLRDMIRMEMVLSVPKAGS